MRHRLAAFVILCFVACSPALAQGPGALVAVGGGGTTDGIVSRTLELAGGKGAVVVVLPQASAVENAGDSSVRMWLEAGAKEAAKVGFADASAKEALARAKGLGLWPGAIVDQHFLRRQRNNRLLSAVVIFDPREATVMKSAPGEIVTGTGLQLAVLKEGMTYQLK